MELEVEVVVVVAAATVVGVSEVAVAVVVVVVVVELVDDDAEQDVIEACETASVAEVSMLGRVVILEAKLERDVDSASFLSFSRRCWNHLRTCCF